MKSCRIVFVLLGLMFICSSIQAQRSEQDKIKELEQLNQARKQQEVKQLMDSAVALLSASKYLETEKVLNQVLKSVKAVSSELTYLIGENSFHLAKYRQSIDWLTKYIQLKGTTGEFSTQAALYLRRAEEALSSEVRQQRAEAGEILSKDFDIDCGPTGKVICPVCSGKTVIVKRDYLSEKFTKCPHCDVHGFLTCEQYNLLLKGQLKSSTN
ncbi:MAG: hypothetical protein FJZ78_10740 [Bacteroidetes bacterium]|nr:hypothetical protein [Bacteroidota bacterium]